MKQFSIPKETTCTKIQDKIEAYLEGELDTDTLATVTAHVQSCPRCQNEVRFAEAISEALRELPRPEPPPKIFNEVSDYVRAHSDTDRKWMRRVFQIFVFRGKLTAFVISSGVLVCLVGILFFGIHQYQQSTRIVQASHDLNYALGKLHYAMERTDRVVSEKLSEVQIHEMPHRSFIMIEEASRRVLRQKMNISSAIHRSLDSLNEFPEIINTKYDEHSHQEGDIP